MKYKLRVLHATRGVPGYAEGECDAIYVRSGDVSWISEKGGVVIITTDKPHLAKHNDVVDIMAGPPEAPEENK